MRWGGGGKGAAVGEESRDIRVEAGEFVHMGSMHGPECPSREHIYHHVMEESYNL
jgi:hypothetical protein